MPPPAADSAVSVVGAAADPPDPVVADAQAVVPSDSEIARTARDALANRLGERYAAVVVDGEDVVITAQRGSPRFTVELLRDTALDVDVEVDRD